MVQDDSRGLFRVQKVGERNGAERYGPTEGQRAQQAQAGQNKLKWKIIIGLITMHDNTSPRLD